MSMPDAGGVNDAVTPGDAVPAAPADLAPADLVPAAAATEPAPAGEAPAAHELPAEAESLPEPDPELEAPAEREPVVTVVEREVTVERSVRYGRILIVGAVIGAVLAMIASALRPIGENAEYTLGEVAGFMALIGAAIGLGVSALFALVLGLITRKRRSTATAVQSDVQ